MAYLLSPFLRLVTNDDSNGMKRWVFLFVTCTHSITLPLLHDPSPWYGGQLDLSSAALGDVSMWDISVIYMYTCVAFGLG